MEIEKTDIRYLEIREATQITGISGGRLRYYLRNGYIDGKRLGKLKWLVGVTGGSNLIYKEVVNG
jgi:hypothetical protein